jgi:hypothetical protein
MCQAGARETDAQAHAGLRGSSLLLQIRFAAKYDEVPGTACAPDSATRVPEGLAALRTWMKRSSR